MFNLICKTFIKNYEDVENPEVRQNYGVVFSIVSIVLNIVMVIMKLVISFVTNSVSIMADAINNMSDVGSNVATLFGFKLASKHPDADHPYGHGRMEYISGMIVSFLILLMGFQAIKDSIMKIFGDNELFFSISAVLVLLISIAIKLLMSILNKKAGKKINSSTLMAASKDSLNDSMMTFVSLVTLVIFKLTGLNIDAYVGTVASLMVLKSGIEIFKDVSDTILGVAPDQKLIKDIEKDIMAHDRIKGIHDLMLHDYGPSKRFMSLHAEVDCEEDIIELHDLIDNIEIEILNKYHILTTIHMDPIDTKNEDVARLRQLVKDIVVEYNENYTIHDFRMVPGPTHTNLVFDVLVPAEEKKSEEEIRKEIFMRINKFNNTYFSVIKIDRDYV